VAPGRTQNGPQEPTVCSPFLKVVRLALLGQQILLLCGGSIGFGDKAGRCLGDKTSLERIGVGDRE
jgi:hypothetical protein